MSSALEQFERSLVRASQTLHSEAQRPATSVGRAPRIDRVREAMRRRGWRIPAGVLLLGALAGAGTAVFGPTGNPREITQIECGQQGSSAFVTGEPLRDCTTLWPSLYHRRTPRLTAWVAETGGVVVVTPAGQPPAGAGWRRLPAGWKADSVVLGLHLQLEDITSGLEAHLCWSTSSASSLVRSILRSDGLGSWQVHVHENLPDGAHPNCLTVVSVVGGEPHSVLLVETPVQDPGDPARMVNTPSGPVEHARLTATETTVNRMLKSSGQCATAGRASALWRTAAAAAGIPRARYVLFTQADGASGCARILVTSPGGGGPADVYATELP